jgi:hypothetical protein
MHKQIHSLIVLLINLIYILGLLTLLLRVKDITKLILPFLYRTRELDICMSIKKCLVININKGTIRA